MRSFYCLCSVLFTLTVSAQQSNIILGKIKDTNNNALESITIRLLQSTDTTNIATTPTNKQGIYSFKNITKGSYVIKATAIGMKTITTGVFEVNRSEILIPDIVMLAEVNKLKEVTVTTQTNPIEAKEGKLIYNVEKSITATGSNAFDIMRRTPGVTVDGEDNIMLKGSTNVNVMMDGKMTYLSAQQLSNLLKSTPAESLTRVEVITTPSSQYDASGSAGIINIVTKKTNRQGYALNVGAGVGGGRYGQTNESIIGNMRTKAFNFFGSYNYSYNHSYMNRTSYRTVTTNGKAIAYDRRSFDPEVTSNHGYKAGVDIYINKNNEIGLVYNGYSNHWSRDANGPTYLWNANGTYDSVVQNHNITIEPSISNSYNLNYSSRLDTSGKELTFNADYATYNNHSNGSLGNGLFSNANVALQPYQLLAFEQPTYITIRSIKADVVLPYKFASLKGGLKYSYVTSDNNFVYDSLINGSYVYSAALSNHFVYDEKIYAGYLSFNKDLNKKTSIDAGVRIESTSSKGNSVTSQIVTPRNYTNFFPYLSLTKNLDDNNNNNINFSITRRINRPIYSYLNPFRYFFDKYSYTEGNPYLQPELGWNVAISYTLKKDYILTIGYTRTNNPILSFARQDSTTGIMRISNYNFSHKDLYDALFVVPLKITTWWNAQNTIDINYQTYFYQENKTTFNPHKLNLDFETLHTFSLPWQMSAEALVHYTSPSLSGIYVLKYYFAFEGGVRKSFFKKRLDAKISFTDLFKTDHYWGYSVSNTIDVKYNHTYDSRRVKLNLTWHFGGKLSAGKEHKVEEKDRL